MMTFRIGAVGAAIGVAGLALTAPGHAATYTETFETAPGGTGYAALLSSPNGVTYDMYDARAFQRLTNITVIGTGDEGFYWGNNGLLPPPRYGLPGTTYSSNTTNYLLNGYGTGYPDVDAGYPNYVLGIDFTHGATVVDSLDLGLANGSNAPAPNVTVRGLLDGVEQWSRSTDVGGNITLATGSAPVDRIEIDRTQNTTPLFGAYKVGWYTLDNLTYEIAGAPTGGYTWRYYSAYDYLGALGGAPEPATWAMLLTGFGLVGAARRRSMRVVAA